MSTSAYLNSLDAPERIAYRSYRWSWRTRLEVAGAILLLASLIPWLALIAWHGVTISETADAAGVAAAHTSTTARWVAKAPSGSSKVDVFVRQTLDYARQGSVQTGWPVALILAQWYIEHDGYLPDRYVMDGYDVAHAVPFPAPQGVCLGYGTNADGSFCYAKDMQQGLAIWVHVAKLVFYQQVPISAKQSDEAAARALGASPWASSRYQANGVDGGSLISVMQQYSLRQYDH